MLCGDECTALFWRFRNEHAVRHAGDQPVAHLKRAALHRRVHGIFRDKCTAEIDDLAAQNGVVHKIRIFEPARQNCDCLAAAVQCTLVCLGINAERAAADNNGVFERKPIGDLSCGIEPVLTGFPRAHNADGNGIGKDGQIALHI